MNLFGQNNLNKLINSYQKISINQTLKQMFSASKRITNSLKCSDIVDLGNQLSSVSDTYLLSIDPNEFYNCQTLLGSTIWSSSQLNALASIAKSVIFI